MTGYSKTPLVRKLGFRSGMRVLLVNAPEDYIAWIAPLPDGEFPDHPPYDLVHIFENSRDRLEHQLLTLRHEVALGGMIWVSWYKKASKLPSEITEDTIRDLALPTGLVDIKVCSVNESRSGLKLVIRKELRK